MTDTTKTEALRLAGWLELHAESIEDHNAAAELRRLSSVEGMMQAMLDASNTVIASMQGQRDRLAAECEALRADAERYRDIKRLLYAENIPIGEAYLTLRVVGACPDASEWDAAIDAAMGGKESQRGNASGQQIGGE